MAYIKHNSRCNTFCHNEIQFFTVIEYIHSQSLTRYTDTKHRKNKLKLLQKPCNNIFSQNDTNEIRNVKEDVAESRSQF